MRQSAPRRNPGMDVVTFEAALQQRAADILVQCVACGACAEVCPMPAPAGIDVADPRALTEGVLILLRGGTHEGAARWAEICSGSGHCILACQHGVNPRLMLALARLARQDAAAPVARR